ncbi:hypothetical protein UP09_23855 [Bradyrhizobium sp. LTSP885]|nr:hypothetical protein UP09_23855 [Bradyrhizobium sp. LTSP885]
MNGLDAVVGAVRYRAGIQRVSSWQMQDGLVAGGLQRLLIDHELAPIPLHLISQPSRLASPNIRAIVDYLAERGSSLDTFEAVPRNRSLNKEFVFTSLFNHRFVWYTSLRINLISAALTMNFGSTEGYLAVARTGSTP